MIRKWLKFNVSFVETLKNSTASKDPNSKWALENGQRCQNRVCHGSLTFASSTTAATYSSLSTGNGTFNSLPSLTPSSVNSTLKLWLCDPWEKGDNSELSESEESEFPVEEPSSKTVLFEMRGPKASAFLVEVYTKDFDEVRHQLNDLKGDLFHFDKSVLDSFAVKCSLTAELLTVVKPKDRLRLAKIHAIVSGSEEVRESDKPGQFLFINSVDRTIRAKTILEKLHYRVLEILYRFQPTQKVSLEEKFLKVCRDFIADVQNLPKVLSVTHNL